MKWTKDVNQESTVKPVTINEASFTERQGVYLSLLSACVALGAETSQKPSLWYQNTVVSRNASPPSHHSQVIMGYPLRGCCKSLGTSHMWNSPPGDTGVWQRESMKMMLARWGLWKVYSQLLDVCLIGNLSFSPWSWWIADKPPSQKDRGLGSVAFYHTLW